MISAIIGSPFCAENLLNSILADIKIINTKIVAFPKGRKIIKIASNVKFAIAPIKEALLHPNFTATEPATKAPISDIGVEMPPTIGCRSRFPTA